MDNTEVKTFTYKVISFPSKQECDKNIKVLDSLKPYLSTISCNYNNRNKTAKFAVAVSPQSLKMQKIMEKCGHRQFKNLDIKAEIDNVTDNFFKILAD